MQHIYKTEKVSRVLLKTAPPVMLAQLVLALYNIVDSFFIGRYSADGLTALSVIFPVQLLITALAVGSGVGVNTLAAFFLGRGQHREAEECAGTGSLLAFITWLVVALLSVLFLPLLAKVSSNSAQVAHHTVVYGSIVCIGSLPVFMEGCWTKIHQAHGNMRLPMIAQICGAAVNIVLDPILIFGLGPLPRMGIAGAAVATVLGQFVAACITASAFRKVPEVSLIWRYTARIYKLGFPSILMQALYTVYILALNIILSGFCDEAVTALGLYYKLQTFFFIPLFALETCIVPFLSYNFARKDFPRCKEIMSCCFGVCTVFMLLAALCFEFMPAELIGLFSKDPKLMEIGIVAFRIIGLSFLPGVLSLITPIFFQAIGAGFCSSMLSVLRQIVCLVPIFWLCSLLGLNYSWLSFPLSETIAGVWGWILYKKTLRQWGLK